MNLSKIEEGFVFFLIINIIYQIILQTRSNAPLRNRGKTFNHTSRCDKNTLSFFIIISKWRDVNDASSGSSRVKLVSVAT